MANASRLRPGGPPVPGGQRGQLQLPGPGLGGVVQNLLELRLQLAGPQVAAAVVQPHAEEAAPVVHHQVLAVLQVLDKVWNREGREREGAEKRQVVRTAVCNENK